MLHYEIGGHDRGWSGPTHDTVDNNQPSALDSLVNEGSRSGEISDKKKLVRVSQFRYTWRCSTRADHQHENHNIWYRSRGTWLGWLQHVSTIKKKYERRDRNDIPDGNLCSVQHVGHSDPLQIIHVTNGVSIAENNSVVNFVTINSDISSLVVITGRLEARQWSVFPGPRVNYRVDQLVPGGLSRPGGWPQPQISAIIWLLSTDNIPGGRRWNSSQTSKCISRLDRECDRAQGSPVFSVVLPVSQPRHRPLSDGPATQTCRWDGQTSGGNWGLAGGDGQTPGGDYCSSRDIRRADGLAGV